MANLPDWGQQIKAIIGSDDPLSAVESASPDIQFLDDLRLRLYFPVPPPMGILAREMAKVDRGFRYGARLAETGMSVDEFRSRSRPPILPLRDGLIVQELTFGSLEVKFNASPRIKKSLKQGAIVVVTATAYLNDSFGIRDHLPGVGDKPRAAYLVPAPEPERQLDIGLVRGNELVTLTLQAPDGFVYLLPELKASPITPLPQLESPAQLASKLKTNKLTGG
jgi:hypothetical protein